MDDLALHDDFSEQNRSWDDAGTIISDTYGTYQKIWGPGCQIHHEFFDWIGLYIHFEKKSSKNQKNQYPSKFWDEKLMFSNQHHTHLQTQK